MNADQWAPSHRQTDRPTNWQTNRQTYRQTYRQTNRQAFRLPPFSKRQGDPDGSGTAFHTTGELWKYAAPWTPLFNLSLQGKKTWPGQNVDFLITYQFSADTSLKLRIFLNDRSCPYREPHARLVLYYFASILLDRQTDRQKDRKSYAQTHADTETHTNAMVQAAALPVRFRPLIETSMCFWRRWATSSTMNGPKEGIVKLD